MYKRMRLPGIYLAPGSYRVYLTDKTLIFNFIIEFASYA